MQLPQFRKLDPVSRGVLEAARRAAAPSPIYAVGGYVRDLLLGQRNVDIDLVVEGDAIAVARRLAHSLEAVVTPHPRFGTAHLRLPECRMLDLATARSERYPQSAALPEVQPAPLLADLLRRDFSMNAMAARIDRHRFGPLIDPLGGLRDLERGRIRVLHERSFIDDPTRLFRTARFEGRYRFVIARSSLRLMKAAVKGGVIGNLAGSRIFRELHLIAKEPSAPRIIRRLGDLGVWTAIHPKLALPAAAFGLLERTRRVLTQSLRLGSGQAPSMPLLEAAADGEALLLGMLYLLHPKTVVAVLKRLTPPHRIAEKLAADHKACRNVAQKLTRAVDLRQSRMARLLDPLSPEARIVLLATLVKGSAREAASRYLTTSGRIMPLLKGADLRQLGLRPGPIYGRILVALRAAKLDGHLRTKEDETSFVLRHFASGYLRD